MLSIEREIKGYDVEQIAEALIMDKDEYVKKEVGLMPFKACEMFRISQFLEKKISDLFEGGEIKKAVNRNNAGNAMMNCLIDFVEHKVNHLELIQWELEESTRELSVLFEDTENDDIYNLYRKNVIYSEAIANTLDIVSRELISYREIIKCDY